MHQSRPVASQHHLHMQCGFPPLRPTPAAARLMLCACAQSVLHLAAVQCWHDGVAADALRLCRAKPGRAVLRRRLSDWPVPPLRLVRVVQLPRPLPCTTLSASIGGGSIRTFSSGLRAVAASGQTVAPVKEVCLFLGWDHIRKGHRSDGSSIPLSVGAGGQQQGQQHGATGPATLWWVS